jgi:hypothetical protein
MSHPAGSLRWSVCALAIALLMSFLPSLTGSDDLTLGQSHPALTFTTGNESAASDANRLVRTVCAGSAIADFANPVVRFFIHLSHVKNPRYPHHLKLHRLNEVFLI